MTGEYAPVYMVMGMVVVAISIGMHTAKQQLRHSPGVYLVKKKRESLPEADTPDVIAASGGRFINKSFLRKVGHIQDPHPSNSPANPFTRYFSFLFLFKEN